MPYHLLTNLVNSILGSVTCNLSCFAQHSLISSHPTNVLLTLSRATVAGSGNRLDIGDGGLTSMLILPGFASSNCIEGAI